MSKVLAKSELEKVINWLARIRWPVDDIGKNSVMPSMIPKMIAMSIVVKKFIKIIVAKIKFFLSMGLVTGCFGYVSIIHFFRNIFY